MRAKQGALVPVVVLGCLWCGQAVQAQDDDPVVFREEGEASFYGDQFHGKATASGETFDQDKLTAAHPELPLGSEVTVTNPESGKSVEVEVNDRGPYAGDRAIDLSKAAAEELGIVEEGVAEVEIEATKTQVEEAIAAPEEQPKVEEALEAAREEAAASGTPQPEVPLDLAAPETADP